MNSILNDQELIVLNGSGTGMGLDDRQSRTKNWPGFPFAEIRLSIARRKLGKLLLYH